MKKTFRILTLVLALIMCFTVLFTSCGDGKKKAEEEKASKEKYEKAFSLIEEGKPEEAYELFDELGDYKNAEKELKKFRYVPTKATCKREYEGEEYSATQTISYDENNFPKQVIYQYSDGDKNIYDYTYDDKGNCIREVYTYSDGDKDIYDYTYDDKGNCIKEVYTYSDGDKETYETEYKLVYIPVELTDEEFEEIYGYLIDF